MAHRRRVAELRAGVHVALVVVLDDDEAVVADRGADRGACADVHAAVAGDHHERDVVTRGELAAANALVEHLDEPRERRRAVLEQVVDVRDPVRRERVAGADDHRAAGLVEDDDVALKPVEERVQRREDAAAGARAVAGGDRLRPGGEAPGGRRLDLQAPVGARLDRDQPVRARLLRRDRGQPLPHGRVHLRHDAVVVEGRLDAAGLGRVEREPEEGVGVLGVEVAAAEAVDRGRGTASRCPGRP